jgi:hypothetical protein
MRPALLLLPLLVACDRTPPPRTSPESAFARIAPCVDSGGARCLFRELDRDSRWSAASIQRLLAEMRGLVELSYPTEMRRGAYGTWAAESEAADAAGLFEVYCAERGCMKELARGFGAVVEVSQRGEGAAALKTTRGAEFSMVCVEGEWGLSTFRDELQQAKIHLGDTLRQVRRNARAYDEQRIVSGEGGKPK